MRGPRAGAGAEKGVMITGQSGKNATQGTWGAKSTAHGQRPGSRSTSLYLIHLAAALKDKRASWARKLALNLAGQGLCHAAASSS